MSELVDVRLLKAYRNYSAGTVIRATANLAGYLVEAGTAVVDRQASLLPADRRQSHERAVCQPTAVETR